uniref:Uncharacterized protein n=1 Tax=Lepeophtheirus salmonis TaxID=72036 RepID=A0A0K2UJ65_LEPSM
MISVLPVYLNIVSSPTYVLIKGTINLPTLGPILCELSHFSLDIFILEDICCVRKLLELITLISKRKNRRKKTLIFILNYSKYFNTPISFWRRCMDNTVAFGIRGPIKEIIDITIPFPDIKVVVTVQKNTDHVLMKKIEGFFEKVICLQSPDFHSRLNAFKNFLDKPFSQNLIIEGENEESIFSGVIGSNQNLTSEDLRALVQQTESWELKDIEEVFLMIHKAYLSRHLFTLINVRQLRNKMYRLRPIDASIFYDVVYIINLQRRIANMFNDVSARTL